VTVVDDDPPSISCPGALTVGTNVGCTYVGEIGTATGEDNCGSVTITNDAPSAFPKGETTVTWTATDGAGLTATCTQVVTVVDDDAPSITCPGAVTVAICNQPAALGTPVVSDNCDPSPTVVNNELPFYPAGSYTVIWTATDAAGNSNTCPQSLTVNYGDLTGVGFLPPFQPPGSGTALMVRKDASTLPVKYILPACPTYSTALANLSVGPESGEYVPIEGVIVSTNQPDIGTLFRWTGEHYQFNLSLKALTVTQTYRLRATFSNGQYIEGRIKIK
jgi:hypothetical protein